MTSALKITTGSGPCTFCSPTVPVAEQPGPFTRIMNKTGVGASVDLCRACVVEFRVETYEPRKGDLKP